MVPTSAKATAKGNWWLYRTKRSHFFFRIWWICV